MSDDILALLDAEITSASLQSSLEARKSAALTKTRNMGLSRETRSAAKLEAASLDTELHVYHWKVIANVALFTHQHCDNCGSDHRLFVQWMERLESLVGAKTRRLSRIPAPHPKVEGTCLIQRTVTHVCADCIGDFGFDLAAGAVGLNGQPFGVSKSYQQEEVVQ